MANDDITFNIGFKVNNEELKAMTKNIARQGSGFDFSKSNINNADMITAFNKQQEYLKKHYEIAIKNAKHNQESIKKITALYKKQTSVDKFGRTPFQRFIDKKNGIDTSIYRSQEDVLKSIHRPQPKVTWNWENNIDTSSFQKNRAKRELSRFLDLFSESGNGGRNELEDFNYQKQSLESKMRNAKKAYAIADAYGMEEDFTDDNGLVHMGKNKAIKEYTKYEQTLKALKETAKTNKETNKEGKQIVENGKAHDRELTSSITKAGKLYAIYLAIKKAIQAIVALAKGFSNVEFGVVSQDNAEKFGVASQDNAEKGFFSVDAKGALNANNNTTRAAIMRGLQNMGSTAPFSINDYDSAMQHMQELRTKALSGQGIGNDQYVISLQRLSDTLGLGFNAKDIMTNSNINLSDFLKDIMGSVEKFLPELDKLDDIKKTLATNDIMNVFGAGLANAMMANANFNMRTGSTKTVVERVVSTGTSAFNITDFTESARAFAEALAKATDATNDFKKGLSRVFEKPAEKVVNGFSTVVGKINNVLDLANVQSGAGYLAYNNVIGYKYDKGDKLSSLSYWRENEKEINERLAKGISSESDVWFQLLHDPSKKDTTEARGEGLIQHAMLGEIYNKMGGGTLLDIVNDENLTEAERDYVNALIKTGTKLENKKFNNFKDFYNQAMKRNYDKEIQALFGEGNKYDYYGQDFSKYFRSMVSESTYLSYLFGAVTSEPLLGTKTTGANFMETEGGKYILRIELSNNKSFDVPMSAIANNESATIEYEIN